MFGVEWQHRKHSGLAVESKGAGREASETRKQIRGSGVIARGDS